jgi:hypothetical protein
MSRGIPPVRRWRVRYHLANGNTYTVYVQTINKRFARWLGRDKALETIGAHALINATALPIAGAVTLSRFPKLHIAARA